MNLPTVATIIIDVTNYSWYLHIASGSAYAKACLSLLWMEGHVFPSRRKLPVDVLTESMLEQTFSSNRVDKCYS